MSMNEPVNLTNCDREPIHIPGSIQPHGAMLVCEPSSYELLYASRNAADVTGYNGNLIPGLELDAILGRKAAHDLRNAAARAKAPGLPGVVLGLKVPGRDVCFDVSTHVHNGRVFIELEPCQDDEVSAAEALDLTRSLIHRIGLEKDVNGIAHAGARLLRALLNYDRVMIYRFLHNGAGRVIAEAKAPGLGSFLGQHFPASDIPAQARRLYLLNPIRMIGDVDYDPIPLDPPLQRDEMPVDMSFAQLRSVSPIHCEYLRNMGVSASMSISIVVDGKLWGLISCHHDSPKVLPMPLRVGAELFGHYFSLQIAVAEHRASALAAARARAKLDNIVAGLTADDTIMQGLVDRLPDFAAIAGCNGAALWMDGVWSSAGDALDREATQTVLNIANNAAPHAVWSTQELRKFLQSAHTSVAGVLAIPLSMTFGDYLLLFRNEEAHEVAWAGEPVKKTVTTPAGEMRLTPRGSFETWREDVKGRSTPWTEDDLAVAESIGTYLRDVILRQNEVSVEERARTEQRRRILNDELNHRVKNIISLVKSIAIQSGSGAESVDEYIGTLEGRLRALALAHDQSLGGSEGGDLSTLIETEIGLHRDTQSPDRVTAQGPRRKLNERAFGVLALVVHEMMTNAVKYGALSVPEGQLEITWESVASGDCVLTWVESGGPIVKRPSKAGFGTRLIRSAMEYDLRGGADMQFLQTGLLARFVIPAAHVGEGGDEEIQPVALQVSSKTLAGRSILIVEDQGLIAMDAEETLRRLGAEDVRLTPSAEEALRELETFRPDAAVLDFNLGNGTSEPVAEFLTQQGIPFVFTTGYSDRVMIPSRFRGVPLVRKPISDTAIATQIDLASQMGKLEEANSPTDESKA